MINIANSHVLKICKSADICSLQIKGEVQFPSPSFPYFPSFYNKYILLLLPANKEIHDHGYLNYFIVETEACLFVRQINLVSAFRLTLKKCSDLFNVVEMQLMLK